jgi:hypothetical protein
MNYIDKVSHFVARNLPKKIIYWACIDLWADVSTGEYHKMATDDVSISFQEMVKAYAKKYKL